MHAWVASSKLIVSAKSMLKHHMLGMPSRCTKPTQIVAKPVPPHHIKQAFSSKPLMSHILAARCNTGYMRWRVSAFAFCQDINACQTEPCKLLSLPCWITVTVLGAKCIAPCTAEWRQQAVAARLSTAGWLAEPTVQAQWGWRGDTPKYCMYCSSRKQLCRSVHTVSTFKVALYKAQSNG